MLFGIELEVQGIDKDLGKDAFQFLKEVDGVSETLSWCCYDGSVDEGFEIITHPWSWEVWNGEEGKKFLEAVQNLRAKGYRSMDATCSCGLHIHTTMSVWTDGQLDKLVSFFQAEENLEFLTKFSKRSKGSLDRYARIQWVRNNIDETPAEEEELSRMKKAKYWQNRYQALNFTGGATLEFRLFRGTLAREGILRCLQFVKALNDWTLLLGQEETTDRSLTYQNFCRFIYKNEESYPELSSYIKMIGLDE